MKYDKIVEAIFIERPNRFIARVKIDGAEEVELVHVKNTGRCRELLLPLSLIHISEPTRRS